MLPKTIKAKLISGCCWELEDGSLKIFNDPGYLKNCPDGEYYIMLNNNTIISIVPCQDLYQIIFVIKNLVLEVIVQNANQKIYGKGLVQDINPQDPHLNTDVVIVDMNGFNKNSITLQDVEHTSFP